MATPTSPFTLLTTNRGSYSFGHFTGLNSTSVHPSATRISPSLTSHGGVSSWIDHISYHPSTTQPDIGTLVVIIGRDAYLYQVPSWLPGLVLAGVYSDTCQRRSIGRAYIKRVKQADYPRQKVTRAEVEALINPDSPDQIERSVVVTGGATQ